MILDVGTCTQRDDSIFGLCKKVTQRTFVEKEDLCVDFSTSSFVSIGQIVACAAIGKYAKFSCANATAKLPAGGDVLHYLQRVNFLDFVNADIPENFQRRASTGRLLEVTKVSDGAVNNIAERLRSIVSGSTEVDASVASALDYSFGEIIDNVLNHSKTEVDGLVAAQFYPNRRHVEFCVADCGVGIAGSLGSNPDYAHLGGQALLLKAFEEGVGERVKANFDGSPGSGCGHGLAFLARFLEASSGTAWVVSHDNAAVIRGNHKESVTGLYFPGTIICARIPSNVVVKESDLWPGGADRPYYWDAQGNDSADGLGFDDILW